MTKEEKHRLIVYNIAWYSVLVAITLLSAFRANINLFENWHFTIPEWLTASDMQPLFDKITFLALAALLAVRVIVHIILEKTAEQMDNIDFEDMKDRLDQCKEDIKDNSYSADEIKDMLKKVSYKVEYQYDRISVFVEGKERDTRGAWNELFAEYCRTAPKLRKMIERTVKGFKQTLDRWERKD